MPRKPRNARVVLLEQVRTIKRRLEWLRNVWTTESTVFETYTDTRTVDYGNGPEEQQFTNSRKRPRQAHEYPENDLKMLVDAWTQLNSIVSEATRARDAIREHYESLNPGYTIGTRDEE